MSVVPLLTADAPGLPSPAGRPKWGLFTAGGVNALQPDSSFSFEFQQEWKIANYPLEAGAFSSYDKVITPFSIEYVATKGGSEAARAAFLANAKIVAASLDRYTFITPEESYPSCNIAKRRFARTATNGVTLLKVYFTLVQINVTGAGTVTTTASPNGAAQQNNGTVQSTAPTPSQSSSISNAGTPQPPQTGPGGLVAGPN